MSVVSQQILGYVEKRNYIGFVISSNLARSRDLDKMNMAAPFGYRHVLKYGFTILTLLP